MRLLRRSPEALCHAATRADRELARANTRKKGTEADLRSVINAFPLGRLVAAT